MRIVLTAFLAAAVVGGTLLLGRPFARAGDESAPRLDRIDYGQPNGQLALAPAVGAGKRAQGIASQLRGKTQAETLSNIARWIGRNLRLDVSKQTAWRPVDQILAEGSRGSEADRALVFGVLARAAGIPAVWVKTVPLSWPADFQSGAVSIEGELGTVFLEVFLEGRWRLLAPADGTLYDDYDPRARILPGNLLAYDKGGDPHALVLANQPEAWRAQTAAHFKSLDLRQVPWARTTDLLARWRVYITGKGGAASYARATCRALGFEVAGSFDTAWKRNLALARGKTLIVTCKGLRPALPEAEWGRWLPPGSQDVFRGTKQLEKGWISHRLSDGTRVILVTAQEFGPVELAVAEALDG